MKSSMILKIVFLGGLHSVSGLAIATMQDMNISESNIEIISHIKYANNVKLD